jgi:GATA zinc finger
METDLRGYVFRSLLLSPLLSILWVVTHFILYVSSFKFIFTFLSSILSTPRSYSPTPHSPAPSLTLKQRRRRTVYSSRRNLRCNMCGVTETPEWRRGPAGDHTLCNACGLHYAKSLKKQRKERDSRKHSIESLLNEVSYSLFLPIPLLSLSYHLLPLFSFSLLSPLVG